MENERAGHGWTAFLGGLLAGAALGVLFAPRSGKETREAIAGKGRAMKEDLDEAIGKARKEWSDLKGKAHDAATMTKEEVDDFLHFLFDEGSDLFDRVNKGKGK